MIQHPYARASRLAISTFLLLFAIATHAYPELFVDNGLASSCTSHPARRYGGHSAPVQDRTVTFSVTSSGGAAVTSVCPGVEYSVEVDYGSRRRTLLTSSAGKLESATDPTCPNRAYSGSSGTSYTDKLTLPCDTKATTVELKITSSEGSSEGFKQSTTSLPVKAIKDCQGSTCPGAPAAAAAAAAATPAAAAAPAAATTTTAAAEPAAARSASTASALQQDSNCATSEYGYECKVALQDGAALHYSSSGELPPDNACTRSTAAAAKVPVRAAAGSSAAAVHFLLASPLSGYAGLSFPARTGRMNPADAVIGWVDPATAQPQVSAYTLTNYSPQPSSTNFNGLGWASNLGAAAAAGAGSSSSSGTLVCFSRLSEANEAQYVKLIDLSSVGLNWVAHDSPAFQTHQLTGSLTLNMQSGTTSVAAAIGAAAAARRMRAVKAHGALMLLAFVVFLPMGILAARHKWLAGNKKAGGIGASWFHAHRALQISAVVLSLAGFILAVVIFDVSWSTNEPTPHQLYDLHRILGVVVMTFMVLQVIAGLLRPALSAKSRPIWRGGHLVLGWLTVALGIVVVFAGVVMMHELRQQPLVNWLLPVVIILGVIFIAGLALEVMKFKLQRAGRYRPANHYYADSSSAAAAAVNGSSSSSNKQFVTGNGVTSDTV